MAQNVLLDIQENVSSAKVGMITDTIYSLRAKGKCETDAEVQTRIESYFQACRDASIRPGIESLCACLNISRQTLWNWCAGNGCTQARQEMAQNAKQLINGVLEEMSLNGLISPPTAIFLMKNWMHYKDSVEIEPQGNPFRFRSQEEILATYNESLFDSVLGDEVLQDSGDTAESEE